MGLPAGTQLMLLVIFASFLVPTPSLVAAGTAAAAAAAVDWPPPPPPPRLSFSFNFSNLSSSHIDDLRFEGDAAVHGNLVDLTCNSYQESIGSCVGRMSYAHAVPFYDGTTGEVACFSTRFTFAIRPSEGNRKGDGMAFFVTGYPSSLPYNSAGANLGLHNATSATGAGQFFAVEFDTYPNSIDRDDSGMEGDHIGIDVNSVRSANATAVQYSLKNGSLYNGLNGTMTATITFDNTTRRLVASLHLDDHPSAGPFEVSLCLPDPVTSLLPQDVAVGFSAANGIAMELHHILAWSFNSTLGPPRPKGPDKKPQIIGGGLAALLLSVLMVWFILSYWKLTSRKRAFEKHETGGPRRFKYSDLVSATNKFSNKLGEGGFGVVYKGTMEKSGQDVAVKILNDSGLGDKDFFAELNTINAAKHRNLVKLVGWCRKNNWSIVDFLCWCTRNKGDTLILVYDLVANGNLEEHLQNSDPVLPWEKRYSIVKDIGSALVYLHWECEQYILHRDIKPSNILLDNDFNAKLADFGLSRIADQNNAVLTAPIGSIRYMDPQCMKNEQVQYNPSSDIYSFGIVLLEIACGVGVQRERVWDWYKKCKCLVQDADDKLGGNFCGVQRERVCDGYTKNNCKCLLQDADDKLGGNFCGVQRERVCGGYTKNNCKCLLQDGDDKLGGNFCGVQRERVWDGYTKNNCKCLLQVADDKLGNFDPGQMRTVIILGLWCSILDVTKRPTSQQVMQALDPQHPAELPNLVSLLNTNLPPDQQEADMDAQAPWSAESPCH